MSILPAPGFPEPRPQVIGSLQIIGTDWRIPVTHEDMDAMDSYAASYGVMEAHAALCADRIICKMMGIDPY